MLKNYKLLRGETRLCTEEGLQSTKARRLKAIRSQLVATGSKGIPSSYTMNTEKESLVLQYVRDFMEKFLEYYPDRKDLLVISNNEYSVPKFVCSTLRPTLLPYKELYDCIPCAKFFATYLNYEPLEHATRIPSCLPSPSQTLDWGCGDSFDFSNLLVSFLLGAGYDAYVVYGRAPSWITLKDQSHLECPLPIDSSNNHITDDLVGLVNMKWMEKILRPSTTPGTGGGRSRDMNRMDNSSGSSTDYKSSGGGDEKKDDMASLGDNLDSLGLMADSKDSNAEAGNRRGSYELKPLPRLASNYLKEREIASQEEPPVFDPFAEAKGTFDNEEYIKQNGKNKPQGWDPLEGCRLHAWVLIRAGKRDVNEHVFLEPSTGNFYKIADSPYFTIEAAFNHQNYHILLNAGTQPLNEISFDWEDSTVWEHIYIDPFNFPSDANTSPESIETSGSGTGIPGAGVSADSDSNKNDPRKVEIYENILDFARQTWVSELYLSKKDLQLKYPPHGNKTTFYYKTKVEQFTEGQNKDGCVLKLTEYLDEKRLVVNCSIEVFKYRQDKLNRRITWPLENKTEEHFLPGRPGALKSFIEYIGKRQESYYYVESRLDGLESRIVDLGVKVFEHYSNRPDHLQFKSARLAEPLNNSFSSSPYTLEEVAPQGKMTVVKMTEKYDTDDSEINEESTIDSKSGKIICAKRTFYVSESRIRIVNHFGKSRITRERNLIFKDRALVQNTTGSNDNGFEDAKIDTDEESLHLAQLAEKECFTSLRHNHMEYLKLLENRVLEEKNVTLEFPVYYYDKEEDEQFRQKRAAVLLKAATQKKKESNNNNNNNADAAKAGGIQENKDEETEKIIKIDYLTPFLQLVSDQNNLSRDEARHIRDMCLKATKERLLERANIIQSRLNEENTALAKLQANFQRSQQASDAGEEEYNKSCSASMFRIRILKERLQEHESSTIRKIEELDEKLANDPRLILALRS